MLTAIALNYLEIFVLFFKNDLGFVYSRAFIVQNFLFGLQDICVAIMLWLMMESKDRPLFKEDNTTGDLYQILKVVRDRSESDLDLFGSANGQILDEDFVEEEIQSIIISF